MKRSFHLGMALFLVPLMGVSLADELDLAIMEEVYRAEVHGKPEDGLRRLREMLGDHADPVHRTRIVRAISVIKRNLPMPGLRADTRESALGLLRAPEAVFLLPQQSNLLVGGIWLELGDWIDDLFILDIDGRRILLESRDGFPREITLPEPTRQLENGRPGCVLFQANIGDVLGFISKQEGLNSFMTSEIDAQISGYHPIPDWLTFLGRICKESRITWTLYRENVMFRPEKTEVPSEPNAMNKISIDRKNERLNSFLQSLADTFDMELVLDDRIGDINVDIYLEEQTWEEALDCLSIMNGFAWFLVKEPKEKPRLIIQKE